MSNEAQPGVPIEVESTLVPVAPDAQIVDAIMSADIETALPMTEKYIAQYAGAGEAAEATLAVLQSLWNYFKAFEVLRKENDFANAAAMFEETTAQFDKLGQKFLRDLATGMYAYCAAVAELRRMNIGAAQDFLGKAKNYLQRAGKFSSRYQILIAIMEPDALFVAGIQALVSLDFVSGKALIHQAAQASEEAAKFFEKDSPEYSGLLGQAQLQLAFYAFVRAYNDLVTCQYDSVMGEEQLTEPAQKARDLLGKANLNFAQTKISLLYAEGLISVLEAIQELAKVMQKIFTATVKVDFKTLQPIGVKIKQGGQAFSQCGPQGVAFMRMCDQLYNQVQNIERLARPDKKDFGKFSGVIACALFLPIFLVMSIADQRFGLKLEGNKLVSVCLSLSLIGGFGFGALRFKNFIGSLFKSEEKET